MRDRLSPELYLDLIGTPWRLHARGPEHLDCVGVVIRICERRGLRVGNLDSAVDEVERAQGEGSGWRPVMRGDIRPGDALLFRSTHPRWHVGVAIDDCRMVHSSEDAGGVVVERFDSLKFARRLHAAYKWAPSDQSQS